MTHLVALVLGYPLVVAASVWVYAEKTDADLGKVNAGFVGMWMLAITLVVVMHYV
jgi:hypothetical protein